MYPSLIFLLNIMWDSVKNLTKVKMYDTYFFALSTRPINLSLLL